MEARGGTRIWYSPCLAGGVERRLEPAEVARLVGVIYVDDGNVDVPVALVHFDSGMAAVISARDSDTFWVEVH